MFSGWKWWGEEEEEQEESAKRLKAIFEHLNASNQGHWMSGMIATRKKATQCCHHSRMTLNAPFTQTAFCVLQGLLVNSYYLVKFSRVSYWIPCGTSANLEILAPSARNNLWSQYYICSFCQGCTTIKILLKKMIFFSHLLKKISTKAFNKKILILQRKTSKLISLFQERMEGISLLCICKRSTDRQHTE